MYMDSTLFSDKKKALKGLRVLSFQNNQWKNMSK